MFLLDCATPETATDTVAEVYARFPKTIGVPAPVRLLSASPRYLLRQMAVMNDYLNDAAYEPALLAALRYIGAVAGRLDYCMAFNRRMLAAMGLSEREIDRLPSDPASSFAPKEAALLALAAKAVFKPDDVRAGDVDRARAAGWTDAQLLECVACAAQMTATGLLFRAFSTKEQQKGD